MRHPGLALILEAPFTSIRDMARIAAPWLPIGSFLRTKYDNLEKIKKIRAPILVLHGDFDDVVPFDQGKRIFAAAPEPKEFYTIQGSRHNDTYIIGGEALFQSSERFYRQGRTAALNLRPVSRRLSLKRVRGMVSALDERKGCSCAPFISVGAT